MRNLTKTLAAVTMLAPASAYPLGIGDIKLHSFLNQKLDAEIALRLSADELVSDLRISLAPPEKFDEAGVPWNYFLSKIKFKVVTRGDGSAIIKLTSNEVFREPFLDFLLQVSWTKGNMYREFTVLVDPPVGYAQPTVSVVEKAPLTTEPTKIKTKKKYSQPTAFYGVEQGSQYGPTGSRDSLWKIAAKTNHYNNVSIEQMMMAIYKANPNAFFKANVNALKAGYTLDIPDKNIILKLSRKEARAAFKEQDNIWNGRVTAAKRVKKTASQDLEMNTQLKLEAPVEAEINETVTAGLEDSVSSRSDDNPLEVPTTEEGLALQARLDNLEKQLGMMQKMLALKDEKIATLQNRRKTAEITADEKDGSKQIKQLVPDKPLGSKGNKVLQPKSETQVVKAAKPIKPAKPTIKATVQTESDSGFFSNSLNWILSIVGIVLLAVFGLFLWRKRKIEEITEAESMFASASEISLPDSTAEELSVPTMDETTSYDVGTVGESSFLSEFTPSDFDAFDTESNEVDPISEADVYLAYGRYQQAEDLMWQAIEDQPERDECKLKLLEIFYANENKEAFEKYAKELMDSGKHKDQEFWGKVVEMGEEIAPSSSLFSDKTDEIIPSQDVAIDAVSTDKESLGISAGSPVEEVDDVSGGVDFDFSSFGQDEIEAEDKADQQIENTGLDFDLSVFDVEEPATDDVQANDEFIESLDFDLNSVGLNEAVSTEDDAQSNKEAEENASGDIDLGSDVNSEEDFGSLDFSLDNSDANESTPEGESENIEEFEFDFDLGESSSPTPPTSSASIDDLEHGVSDLTDMDELETKIDLAKAYIDMGDVDAAREIAEEVLEVGNEEQKNAAQEIIDQLK